MICRYIGQFYDRVKTVIFNIFIRLFVMPIIDNICPIVDIRVKYLAVCQTNTDSGLTIERWDSYVDYLVKSKKVDSADLDYYDLLILQKLARINRTIKMNISNIASRNAKRIVFSEFFAVLEDELGVSVNFRYRYTLDSNLFESLLGDDGPYRRFRWCDRI
jgi:hypothetical protein